MARMPKATELFITECIEFDQVNAFFRKKGLPEWWAPKSLCLPQQALKLLYKLPHAFVRAGISLVKLHIRLDPHIEHNLILGEKKTRDLLTAAKNLEVLNIDYQMGMQDFRTKKKSAKLRFPGPT
ncbi:hypothetical protein F5883DRAFT_652857 [Diaporthe sp. PMI_573]|nr:hypothetical protein F5883DRAFT_652857 [Diaporthaceae sp. PMI_573]